MINKERTKNFIKKSKEIHDDKYDYLLVDYVNNRTKVKIICKEHGIFEQTPKGHLKNQGCPKCGIIKRSLSKTKTKDEFIKQSNNVHNYKYDYSLIDYKNIKTKIKIICLKHGIFEQRPSRHLLGDGCPKCSSNFKKTQDEFIIISKEIHGDKYNYSLVNYVNNSTKVKINC